jgi:hypothetical protein
MITLRHEKHQRQHFKKKCILQFKLSKVVYKHRVVIVFGIWITSIRSR